MAREISKQDIDKIIKLYKSGKPAGVISNEVGWSASTVRKYIEKECGMYISPCKKKNLLTDNDVPDLKEIREKVLSFIDNGESIDDVAAYMCISKDSVRRFIRERSRKNTDEVPTLKQSKEDIIKSYPINVFNLTEYKEKLQIGSEVTVRKQVCIGFSAGYVYKNIPAQVLSKYPHVVRTTEGDYTYKELFMLNKLK